MSTRQALELLCPARDLEGGLAAINHGADAVYIGAPIFGARAAAGNSLEDISALIAYAHKYWARVYITLNTILYDHELDEAQCLVRRLYEAGADALIVQDMGLLELNLPPLPLFASTQTHNHDVEKIRFLEKVGLQRVILARELTLKQIREIRNETTIDLEFFVHGSLCVSFSGLCYFSQVAMGRSANRGECAQMCRLPYTLTDSRGNVLAKNQHLLSLKDLNLSEYLADLVDAGVTSFKVEGRLKETSYVKNVTAFYRRKIDELLEGRSTLRRSSSGTTMFYFTPDPERTFNRGTTGYFIKGRKRDIVSVRAPKSVGRRIGTVQSVGQEFFILEGTDELHNGDGICFFDNDDELTGININKVQDGAVYPNSMAGIEPGIILYRNYDHQFIQKLKTDCARRVISVQLRLSDNETGFTLHAVDEDGIEALVTLEHPKEHARKPEAALETIKAQLSKLGDSVFEVESLHVDLVEDWFLPVSALNRIRRACIAELEKTRAGKYPRQISLIQPNAVPYPTSSVDYSANVVNAKAVQFYQRHGVKHIGQGVELQNDGSGIVLMTTRHCLKFQFDLCRGESGSAEDLYLLDGSRKYKLEFDCDACVMKIVAP